ncbi:hypothetical protein SOVF_043000 [Spinacia oleracea]|nr:hypothetical protein SOVF_043000 [Spinacia oleracea]
MGNCSGSSSKLDMQDYIPEEDLHQEEEEDKQATIMRGSDDHCNNDDNIVNNSTTPSNTPTPLNNEQLTTTTSMIPYDVDPRLVSLLDFFRQLQTRRKDIFNKVMPAHRQHLDAIFSEMRNVQQLKNKNSKMVGMVRQRSMSFGDEKSLKEERFKVKPIDSGGVQVQSPSDAKGGAAPAGVSKPTASK